MGAQARRGRWLGIAAVVLVGCNALLNNEVGTRAVDSSDGGGSSSGVVSSSSSSSSGVASSSGELPPEGGSSSGELPVAACPSCIAYPEVGGQQFAVDNRYLYAITGAGVERRPLNGGRVQSVEIVLGIGAVTNIATCLEDAALYYIGADRRLMVADGTPFDLRSVDFGDGRAVSMAALGPGERKCVAVSLDGAAYVVAGGTALDNGASLPSHGRVVRGVDRIAGVAQGGISVRGFGDVRVEIDAAGAWSDVVFLRDTLYAAQGNEIFVLGSTETVLRPLSIPTHTPTRLLASRDYLYWSDDDGTWRALAGNVSQRERLFAAPARQFGKNDSGVYFVVDTTLQFLPYSSFGVETDP